MVALILDVAILALGGKRIIGKMLNCRAINVITVFLFVGIVLLRVADYLPYNDIAVFLGKDLTYHSGSTFTGRTYIWDAVIASIRESPLIGYGWQEYVAMGIAHFYGQQDFNSAHNLLLQIVFVGGFVGFALFLMAYLQSSKFVDALRSKSLRCLFVSAFAAFLLTSLFEQVLTSAFLILLSMAVSPVLRELDLEISTIEQDGTVGENPASSSMDARHLV